MQHAVHNEYELFPGQKRVRILLGGTLIADSRDALLLRREHGTPIYYLPLSDLSPGILIPTDHRKTVTGLGPITLYHVRIRDTERTDAAWELTPPPPGLEHLSGYIAFNWYDMDAWFEEDEEIYVHPRDPRKRIDISAATAHVRIVLNGETIAESVRPTLLFETGQPVRYYLPRLDLRQDLLIPSELITRCPYKGEARYFSLRLGEVFLENVIWTYRYPTTESAAIAGLCSFFQDRIAVEVDGERI